MSYEAIQEQRFVTLKRKSPGKFSQDLVPVLRGMLANTPNLKLIKIELGENPVEEDLEVELQMLSADKQTASGGPKLYFTFSSDMSVEENMSEFQAFIADSAESAGRSPETDAAVTAIG